MCDVINYHDRKTQQYRGEHGGIVHKFEKTVNRVKIVVIAETKKNDCWPLSVWKEA